MVERGGGDQAIRWVRVRDDAALGQRGDGGRQGNHGQPQRARDIVHVGDRRVARRENQPIFAKQQGNLPKADPTARQIPLGAAGLQRFSGDPTEPLSPVGPKQQDVRVTDGQHRRSTRRPAARGRRRR